MRFHLNPFFATNVANGQDLILPVAPGIISGRVGDCCRCVLQALDTALGIVSLYQAIYALLPALGIPTNRLTPLLASVELLLLLYAHDTQKFPQLQAYSTLGRSGATYARDTSVRCGTQVATRNSNNVRSSSSVKTIRMGAGIRIIAPVQKTNLFHLTFYCSRLLIVGRFIAP